MSYGKRKSGAWRLPVELETPQGTDQLGKPTEELRDPLRDRAERFDAAWAAFLDGRDRDTRPDRGIVVKSGVEA